MSVEKMTWLYKCKSTLFFILIWGYPFFILSLWDFLIKNILPNICSITIICIWLVLFLIYSISKSILSIMIQLNKEKITDYQEGVIDENN